MFSVQKHSCPANGGDDYVCHLLTDDICILQTYTGIFASVTSSFSTQKLVSENMVNTSFLKLYLVKRFVWFTMKNIFFII